MTDEIIFYQFSRTKVERCDFTHFLGLYAPDKLPTGRRLREMMNAMMFAIEGYEHDPREVHSIPEVRRFYTAFHSVWPYWLYFCNLETEALMMMTLCCLPSLSAVQVDGSSKVTVECDPLEILQFIRNDVSPMNLICDRAGMTEQRIFDRTRAVFTYFNLPFEAERPE